MENVLKDFFFLEFIAMIGTDKRIKDKAPKKLKEGATYTLLAADDADGLLYLQKDRSDTPAPYKGICIESGLQFGDKVVPWTDHHGNPGVIRRVGFGFYFI